MDVPGALRDQKIVLDLFVTGVTDAFEVTRVIWGFELKSSGKQQRLSHLSNLHALILN